MGGRNAVIKLLYGRSGCKGPERAATRWRSARLVTIGFALTVHK
jgi:hypothetical protein